MDIFSNIFKSDREGLRRSHVKNLIEVALADGHLATEEWNMMVYLAEKFNISEHQIKDIKDNPDSVKFVVPKSHEESVLQIEDLLMVMTVDHEINPTEVELIKKIAIKLNVLPQKVDELISHIKGN
jgi:uncharacterized tellurite resistance protein B-like protein